MDEFPVRQLEIFLTAQDVCFIWTAIPKTMEVLRLHVKNYRVTAFSEQKVFPFNHFRFDSVLSFREDTADENLTVVISCVGREANAMQIGGTFNVWVK